MQLFRLPRLSGQLLSHITLCISATSSERLISSTLHSTSTQKRLAINYSSSLIIKHSSLPGSLVVLTWFSSVVHPAAFSFSGLALCLLHSETLPCPRPRGLMPSTRIVSPCFARPRFQLGLSSRAPPDFTKRVRSDHCPTGRGLHSSRCTQPCKCFNAAISQAMHVLSTVFLPSTRQFRTSS